MSHTTTSTSSFTILKYSRSTADPSSGEKSQANDLDWQHFVNPVIRLVLDTTKTSSGDLSSVRMRILWNMNAGQDAMDIDQREVIFEDLDLLSFSPGKDSTQLSGTSQGLPLKAVFRDSIVGIRYLRNRVPGLGVPPSYRRIQINFDTAASATQFINSIRLVCPCKPNNPHGPVRNATMNSSAAMSQMALATAPSVPPVAQPMRRATALPQANAPRPSPRVPAKTNGVPSSESDMSLFAPAPAPSSHMLSLPSDSYSSSRFSSAVPSSDPLPDAPYQRNKARDVSGLLQNEVPMRSEGSGFSLPGSSQSSSNTAALMPPPPVPNARPSFPDALPSDTARASLLASLHETPDLYDLTRSELEGLVSQVVREPGFGKLLENLESLWTVKGFLAH
ncbi:hypothetical protein EWM64_g6461 [Hericium alpestre]|uniref:Uncharacterized protein n=1 Tax=Hericium alpestre TaxID=135208 RepID=A0A4Y9ZRZ1_9AGAM|nr:hypothetical protein EWM64_g6461 [Hericium alpestre]